jgi:ribokinase
MNEQPTLDVICVGSALLDMYMKSDQFVKIPLSQMGDGVALCEVYGGKTEISESELTSGGGGTNNAVSFARKGFRTALIAEMGTDLVAATIREELTREGVDVSMLVQEKSEETGMAAILVSQDGGRSVAVYRGASKMLTKSDIPWDSLHASWIHISSLGGDVALLEGLIGHAKTHGMHIAVNPGMTELKQASTWGDLQLFSDVDVLLLNREEASVLLKKDFSDDVVWHSDFAVSGPKVTIISDGVRNGIVCLNGVCKWYGVEPVAMVEQTGAGDAFGTGLVSALMLNKSVEEAIGWGKKQAASVVSYMGPKRGLMTREEIEK